MKTLMKTIAVVSPQALLKNTSEVNLKSINIHGRSVCIALINAPVPDFDASDKTFKESVLIHKHAFSLNFRDTAFIFSADSYLQRKPEALQFFAIGSEFVGTIKAVGANVPDLKVGDRIITNAAYPYSEHPGLAPGIPTNNASKEYEVFHYSKVIRIPTSLPDEEAAGFTIGAQTAFSMIRRSGIMPAETCLITAGSSNTSLFLIAALRHKGVRIVVLTTNSNHVEQLLERGAHRVVVIERNQLLQSNEAFNVMVQEEKKFNIVFDPYSDIYAGQLMGYIAMHGRYITCGVYNQYASYIKEEFQYLGESSTMVMAKIILNNITVMGNCLGTTQDLQDAIDAYEAGEFEVLVDTTYDPTQLTDFFNQTFNSRTRLGKVIMKYL